MNLRRCFLVLSVAALGLLATVPAAVANEEPRKLPELKLAKTLNQRFHVEIGQVDVEGLAELRPCLRFMAAAEGQPRVATLKPECEGEYLRLVKRLRAYKQITLGDFGEQHSHAPAQPLEIYFGGARPPRDVNRPRIFIHAVPMRLLSGKPLLEDLRCISINAEEHLAEGVRFSVFAELYRQPNDSGQVDTEAMSFQGKFDHTQALLLRQGDSSGWWMIHVMPMKNPGPGETHIFSGAAPKLKNR